MVGIDTVPRRLDGAHVGRRSLAVAVLALIMALALAPSAWASVSATLAPIGSASSGSYLLTVTNSGPETEGNILIGTAGPVEASSIVPSTCVDNAPIAGQIGCPQIPAGGMLQVCYTGPAVTEVRIFYGGAPSVGLSTVGAVASCPLPGFTAPPAAPAPISLGKVTANAKKGTATVATTVPGPGTLRLSGKGAKTATAKAKAAGPVILPVKATGKAATRLASTGKVTLKVSVTFTPTEGSPVTETKTVKLVKKLPKN